MALPDRARYDVNKRDTLMAVSNADGETPVTLWADPNTHTLITTAGGGGGSGDGAILDGVNGTIKATVFSLTNSKPLATQIVDATGTAITSFGGGTQYTNGQAIASDSVVGSAALGYDGANLRALKVTTSGDQLVAGDFVEFSGLSAAALNADLVPATDVSAYRWISLQITGAFSATVTFQGSNDNVNFNNVPLSNSGSASNPNPATANSASIYEGPIFYRYFRVRVTSYASGTVTGTLELYTLPTVLHTLGVAAQQSGTWTTRLQDGFGNTISQVTPGDGITAAPTNVLGVANYNLVYNGTTADRMRSDGTTGGVAVGGSVAAGVTDAGQPMKIGGVYNTSPPIYTNGQRGNIQIDSRGSVVAQIASSGVYVTGTDDNTDAQATVGTASRLGVAARTTVFNGTTWDRLRGDTTNGAFVQVKSNIPGTGATNLGKAEDAAHVSGDTGVFSLGVRNDGGQTTFTSADGDYSPIATDRTGSVQVVQKAQTGTLSNVAGSATSVTVLAANNNRKGAQIYNDSTAILYLKLGSTASTTSYTIQLAAGSYFEIPGGYVGIIDGIWASATGSARVTELT